MLTHHPTSTPAPVWYALTFGSTLLSKLTLVIVFMGAAVTCVTTTTHARGTRHVAKTPPASCIDALNVEVCDL
jgi:hypothetical protein